jgi:predicted transcriptional regulator
MKSVMISIQPKWCELIASGRKTVEVRKTKPKIDVPFKCYIYCTKGDWLTSVNGKVQKPNNMVIDLSADSKVEELNGKVIGEFVCRQIDKLNERDCFEGMDEINNSFIEDSACLDIDYILKYKGENEYIYGWHISDLVIYDKPKELGEYGEFYVWKKCNSCRDSGYESTACCYDIDCKVPAVITRPPQSWCYCEELKEN